MKTVHTRQGLFHTWDTGTVTRALESRGDWDEHVGIALQAAQPGGIALDLGAHIGWFSWQLDARHDLVLALEPQPDTVALAWQNLRDSSPNVQLWPCAAYDRPEILTLHTEGADDRGAWCFIPAGDAYVVQVPAIRLDDYLQESIPVHVIKVDCQGADLRALQGLTETIRRDRPLIVFEWEEALAAHHGHTWGDYQEWFAAHAYAIARIAPHFWDYVATPIR